MPQVLPTVLPAADVLGDGEPNLAAVREIRSQAINYDSLLNTTRLDIHVPRYSRLVAISPSDRSYKFFVYYEVEQEDVVNRGVRVPLRAFVVGEEIPPGFRLLGLVLAHPTLVFLYAGAAEELP